MEKGVKFYPQGLLSYIFLSDVVYTNKICRRKKKTWMERI